LTLLEKLTTWGQYSGPWEGKQKVFRSAGGKERIERWVGEVHQSHSWRSQKPFGYRQKNEHVQIILGAMLFKDNPWFNELQQQLMGNAALERYFHIFILVYHLQHGYDFWAMLSHCCIWMNVGRMHPLRLTVVSSVLKPKGALHRMNMGDEHHWWCQCIAFHDLIWQAERNPWRRTLSL